MRPIGDKVVIQLNKVNDKTKGGIIIPDTAKEQPVDGVVYAVGPGKEDIMTVKVGDKVLIGKYTGSEIPHDELDLVIMVEDDILVILD